MIFKIGIKKDIDFIRCNRYGSLCKSVEYPRGGRKLVDNDATFNELIQKMQNEKLRFPIGAMGKELK